MNTRNHMRARGENWFLWRNLSIETLAAILDEAPLKQISTRMKATPIRHNLNIKQRSYEGYAYFIYPIIEPGTGILHGQNGLGPIFIFPISVRLKWPHLENNYNYTRRTILLKFSKMEQ